MKRTITELENLFMISANQAKEITKANSGINQTNIINLLLKSIKETLEHFGRSRIHSNPIILWFTNQDCLVTNPNSSPP